MPRRLVLTALMLWLAGALALAQDTSVSWPIAPGVTYAQERLTEGPWEVRVVRVARGQPWLRLDLALGQGQLAGVEPLSRLVARETTETDYVVAAVNGDFFVMAGNPNAGLCSGLCIRDNELIMTARGNPAFAVMADGTPRIGVFDTTGLVRTSTGELPVGGLNQPPVQDGLTLYTAIHGWPQTEGGVVVTMAGLPLTPNGTWEGHVTQVVAKGTKWTVGTGEVFLRGAGVDQLKVGDAVTLELRTPDLQGPVAMAVGGNPVLMRAGQLLTDPTGKDPRHPRTLVGYNAREILLVTVDGRQPGWSVGMRTHELAMLMQRLGCTEALNLDGGGSTTAWVRGEVRNRPSGGIERWIANAVLVRCRAPRGPLARWIIRPQRLAGPSPLRTPLTVIPTDRWYNPLPMDLSGLQVRTERRSGWGLITARVSDGVLCVSGGPGEGVVRLSLPGGRAIGILPVRLEPRPREPKDD